MPHRVTISDIATQLGLTPATVSRALADKPDISAATKKAVRAMAKKMDYLPNKVASSLRSGSTKLIGVLIPSIEHSFFGAVVNSISRIAAEHGYDVLVYQSDESQEMEMKGLKAFLSAGVDGILVSAAKNTKQHTHFLDVKKRGIPIVFFDRTKEEARISSVVIDDTKGAAMAVGHLAAQGYRRIAFIAGPSRVEAFDLRFKGYKKAVKSNGLNFNPSYVRKGDITIEAGMAAIKELLQLPDPPDAVLGVDSHVTLGALKELKSRGIKVPEEFGVIGFSYGNINEYLHPSLSAIDQQTYAMGQEAFRLIFDMIRDKKSPNRHPQKIVLEPKLNVRQSTLKNGESTEPWP